MDHLNHLNQLKIGRKFVWLTFILSFAMICFLFYYQWVVGFVFTVILLFVYYFVKQAEEKAQHRQIEYITKLSYQVENAGKHIFRNLHFGIIIYNDQYEIEWTNKYMTELNHNESLMKQPLSVYGDDLVKYIRNQEESGWLQIGDEHFKLKIDHINRSIYLFNRTKEAHLEVQLTAERTVLAIIYIDNYEEISRNMTDSVKSQLNSMITSTLNKWAEKYQFYIKRTSQERFIGVFNQKALEELEEGRFEILDDVRNLQMEEVQRNPITLSIGIGAGNAPIAELAKLAQKSLDLALGRGGDQIAIRDDSGKVRFYGGKTNPMEKRTRVRARVISYALQELVKESDNVIIMGHKAPDMDSLGATIGVLNIAKSNNVEGYIVFDENDVMTGVRRVIDRVKKEEGLWKHFIGPEEAEAVYTNRSLVVLVDTHRPGMATHEKLIRNAEYKVVIDHHRRAEEFVDNPTLVYMEPYASSTSELVTELIEYQPKKKKLSALEATCLLSGIVVDTKSFALRTGSRTFDAASYLRSKGADLVMIQEMLKEDLSTVRQRNKLIEKAYVHEDTMAIVKADEEKYEQILIAQAADALLAIENIGASFVIAKRVGNEEVISISARSLGDINVQLIMESLNGGGHLTNAATQIRDKSLDEVEQMLLETIEAYFEGRT